AQGFVRALFVILAAKLVEAALLRAPVGSHRRHGFLLQRQMHTFMPSVLLRMRRLDALVHDAQFYPPHRQPGEAADRTRGKRWAIIGADGPRQAVFAEGGVKDSLQPEVA